MMQRDHFNKCKATPMEKLNYLAQLQRSNTQGACDSKQYWTYAAKTLGLYDTARGIEVTAESRHVGRCMPNFGAKDDMTTTDEASSDLVCGAVGTGSSNVQLLAHPTDARRIHPFLFMVLSQLQYATLLSSERAGKRKSLPLGFTGFGCCYCCQAGRLGFSRAFPLRRRTLPAKLDDMFSHLQRCPLTPPDVKAKLQYLSTSVEGQATSSSGDQDQDRKALYYNSEVLDRIWNELGRKGDVSA